jgi:hypothetical protein
MNAVAKPPFPHRKKGEKKIEGVEWEKKWPLTAGCQLLRDYYKAKTLKDSKSPADKATLDKILQEHNAASFEALEKMSKTAVCVKYIEGRPKEDSRRDWNHVREWCGIQGLTKIRDSGPNKGFYLPKITPEWADSEQHPWLVTSAELRGLFGMRLGDYAVVVANDQTPKVAYGLLLDSGPKETVGGECSYRLIQDLGLSKRAPKDFIYIIFPGTGSLKKQTGDEIRQTVQEYFNAWTVQGRCGIDVVTELFPTHAQYNWMKMSAIYSPIKLRSTFSTASPCTPE